MPRRVVVLSVIAGFTVLSAAAADTFKEVLASTNVFLNSLDGQQRKAVSFPFNSDERLNWHFVPKDRLGLPIKQMNPKQRELALSLLKTLLSRQGYEAVNTIRNLEDVLKVIEGGKGPNRDPELYYFTIFGRPSKKENWGIRFEGHHISLHWTVIDGKMVSTFPQFLGSNPADVKDGPMKGTRALGAEEDLGRGLVKSLDGKQASAAILQQDVPADIVTGDSRRAAIDGNYGLAYSEMSTDQQGLLISLIQVLANVQRPEWAGQRLEKLRVAGLDKIKFAWIGGVEKGQKHYYRVQGPTFVIEYDNTQNDANHIHVVWRDFKGDFGEDMLKDHYLDHADPKHPGEHKH